MSYRDHLTKRDFGRLLHGQMREAATLAAHQHLVQCRACRVKLFVFEEGLAGMHLDDMYGPGTAAKWRRWLDEPVDALSCLARQAFELEAFDSQELWFRAANVPGFQDVGALTVLVEQAHTLRKATPAEAKTMLSGAIHALRKCVDWPKAPRDYLLARALAYLGNLCRILNEFEEAASTFAEARAYLADIGYDPELAGLLNGFEGNSAKDQQQYDLAIDKLQSALVLLPPTAAETRLEAMITLANCYGEAGLNSESIATLEGLIERYPESAFPPGAYLACLQSLGMSYIQTNQPKKAKALLPKIERLAREEGNRLDLVRVEWLKAEIYKAERERTLAAAGFREVTAKFMAAKIPVDAALAALSQADMYLELGDTRAAAELAEDLVPIFESKGIHREATMAGLIVVEDLRREAATAAQVQELVERLQGAAAGGGLR